LKLRHFVEDIETLVPTGIATSEVKNSKEGCPAPALTFRFVTIGRRLNFINVDLEYGFFPFQKWYIVCSSSSPLPTDAYSPQVVDG
jgi:hypothetical protein